jgi:hypothetical protein
MARKRSRRRNVKSAAKKKLPDRAKGKYRVKGHTRSPRGANTGKPAVRVSGYRRRAPRKRK